MFKKLQAKWKVKGWDLLLIISTFAIGGSLCGILGRRLLMWTNLEKNVLWFIIYIILISLLWPLCVLVVSIPLGQFAFFRKYLSRIWSRMGRGETNSKGKDGITRIAIFASGAGSNARKIIEYFKHDQEVKVELIVSNRSKAGVLDIAREHNIPVILVGKDLPLDSEKLIRELAHYKIGFIVLAGFLVKIPPSLIKAFPKKIINIHPALLPAYGGKGMYGGKVHDAVLANNDQQSGISIHFVDELYDHGALIYQATCKIEPGETAGSLAEKVHKLEHLHYPAIIETLIKKQKAS